MAEVSLGSSALFEYTPLPSEEPAIRLVTLLPNCAERNVECVLKNHVWDIDTGHVSANISDNDLRSASTTTASAVAYEALSYTWGDGSSPQQITLNNRVHKVRQNLFAALKHLRDQECPRVIWIDAICINQADSVEKGHQIRQMHRIYQHATQVVVWLGVANDDSNSALKLAKDIYNCFGRVEEQDEGDNPEETLLKSTIVTKTKRLINKRNASAWIALHRLLSRPWWNRVWIYQELMMAKKARFYCGKEFASWPVVELAMQTAFYTVSGVEYMINAMVPPPATISNSNPYVWPLSDCWPALHGLWMGRKIKMWADPQRDLTVQGRFTVTLSDAVCRRLQASQGRLCKFPHDKIYAILGLVPPSLSDKIIQRDYEQPVYPLYKQFVKAFVQSIGSLNVICYSQHPDTQADMPSWTPDWRRPLRMRLIVDWDLMPTQREWHSEAIARFPPIFSHDLSEMKVTGFQLGIVRRTQVERAILPGFQREIKEVQPREHALSFSIPSHQHTEWNFETEARDLLRPALSTLPKDHPIWTDDGRILICMLLLRYDPERSGWSEVVAQQPCRLFRRHRKRDFAEVYQSIGKITVGRTLAETNTSEFCLVPFWAEEGDFICQLIGCSVPVVLRRRGDGRYTYVGDCYVYRKMRGEMIELLERKLRTPNDLERFELV